MATQSVKEGILPAFFGRFLLWVRAVRAPFFTATIVPVLLGSTYAWRDTGAIRWPLFLLTMICAILFHAGALPPECFITFFTLPLTAHFTTGMLLVAGVIISKISIWG